MEIKNNWYEKSEYFILSCVIHMIGLLLLSFKQEDFPEKNVLTIPKYLDHPSISTNTVDQRQPSEQQNNDPFSAPLLNAPCILYKPGKTEKKGPPASPAPEKVKVSLEGEKDGDIFESSTTEPSPISQSLSTSAVPHEELTHKDVSQKKNTNSETKQPEPTPIAIETITSSTFLHDNTPITSISKDINSSEIKPEKLIPELNSPLILKAEKVFDASPSKETQENSDGTRKRKLTLSDLFKNLSSASPLFSQEDQDGDGDGAPSVIVQGDIRYHSFVTSLVEHINSTSIHKNGQTIIRELIKNGAIKQNLKLSMTLEKSGKVIDARALISSGCKELDSFWIAIAYAASPFAPLPNNFKRDMVRVELVTQL